MPKLNSSRIKHRIAELFDGNVAKVAEATDIPYGSLRNAVAGTDPIKLYRVYRLSAALDLPVEELLEAGSDGTPDPPPEQPPRPKGPKPKDVTKKAGKAPKRHNSSAGAA